MVPGQIAGLEALDVGTHLGHPPHDLVAGDHGEQRAAPLVPHLVDIGVADAAVGDLDQHIVGTHRPALDFEGPQGQGGGWGGIGFGGVHGDSCGKFPGPA